MPAVVAGDAVEAAPGELAVERQQAVEPLRGVGEDRIGAVAQARTVFGNFPLGGFAVAPGPFGILEEFAQATGLEYDAQTQTLGGLKLELAESGEYFTVSGRYFYLDGGLIEDGDELLWPLSELGRLFGFDVVWDSASGSLNVDITDPEQLLPGEEFYNSDDVYWLSRIIYAEAGNQTLEGMLAVGDVVMNRAASDLFPDTVYEVIFDRRYGVQFSPTETGSIYLEPAEECVTAAKLCLEGYDIVGGSLYFVNPDIGVSSWFRLTRTYVTSIGDHDFYA